MDWKLLLPWWQPAALPGPSSPSPSPHPCSGAHTRPAPCFDLSMAKEEVKYRLAPVPVYTVANESNEFVLVTDDQRGQEKQMGFFFFDRQDAEAYITRIREENPRLVREQKPKVLRVTMDAVYEVFTQPREETGLKGIHFRFMPHMKQVQNVLELFHEAGVPTSSFLGVPVFQADGLSLTSNAQQYVPLFLTKEDMDLAVEAAHRARNQAAIRPHRERAEKYRSEWQELRVQAEEAGDERQKMLLEQKADKAEARWAAAEKRASEVEKPPPPKVEVGCLEEVIMRITTAEGPELESWSQVMFVTPGIIAQGSGGGGGGADGGS